MPATLNVWWIGAQALGIGHSSLEIGGAYITWLEDGGGWSSSSSNPSRSSRSSSQVNVYGELIAGNYGFNDDQAEFTIKRGKPLVYQSIPMRGDAALGGPFGLRNEARLTNWWAAARAVVTPVYRAVSTVHNCNVYTTNGLRMASASLYCEAPDFTLYAGSKKVLKYARDLNTRILALNALWARQTPVLTGADDGHPVPTAAQFDANAVRHQFPGGAMRTCLAQYAVPAHERIRLSLLDQMMTMVLDRIQQGVLAVPAAPPVAGALPLAAIAPAPPAAAAAPVAWAMLPLDGVRILGRRIRRDMAALEAAFGALPTATILQNR